VIGIGGWLSIRFSLKGFLSRLSPPSLEKLAAYLIKIGLLATVLVGGMTSKYYGCSGEYQQLKESESALFGKFTGQLASSLEALVSFFLVLLTFSLLFFVIRIRFANRQIAKS